MDELSQSFQKNMKKEQYIELLKEFYEEEANQSLITERYTDLPAEQL